MDILIWIVPFSKSAQKDFYGMSRMNFAKNDLNMYHEFIWKDDTKKYHYDWVSFQFSIDDQFTNNFIYIAPNKCDF